MLTLALFLCLLHDGVRRLVHHVVYSVPPWTWMLHQSTCKGHRAAVTYQGSPLIWLQSPKKELQNVFNTSEDAQRKSDLSMAAHLPSFGADISWNLAFSRSVKAEWRRRLVSRIKHEMVSICRCQRVLYCAVGAMRTMLKDNQCIAWLNDKK